jgi:hypothetical protein
MRRLRWSASTQSQPTLRFLIPQYDVIFTYGGVSLSSAYLRKGATMRSCRQWAGSIHAFSANGRSFRAKSLSRESSPGSRSQGREFFLKPAGTLRELRFLLGGAGWDDGR